MTFPTPALRPALASIGLRLHRRISRHLGRLRGLAGEAELARLAGLSDGRVAMAALHLESGQAVGLDADTPVPMASTMKVPLAVEFLTQVHAGRIDLATMHDVGPHALRPGHGIIAARLGGQGVAFSLDALLRLMLVESDNTATDILLARVGGPSAVTARLAALGITGMRVDRTILQLMSDHQGIDLATLPEPFDLGAWRARERTITPAARAVAAHRLLADPRDSTTPAAMVRLLAAIQCGHALPAAAAERLLRLMQRCATGPGRIPARLPPGSVVAHKTGYLPCVVTADVGVVTLGQGLGHVALAIYVTASRASEAHRDLVIADLARAACDHLAVAARR
ncbi:MAG TPA: serine hydrolase [Gemmatimonadaceae bacterium]|nr:serine hydrolase [Gemmatimonadaceae bacterium]